MNVAEPLAELVPAALPGVPATRLPRPLTLALALVAGVMLLGVALGLGLQITDLVERTPEPVSNVFFYLFATQEPVACAVQLVALLGLVWWLGKGAPLLFARPAWAVPSHAVVWMAALAFAVGAAGFAGVFHSHALSMDEWMADFQAAIFAEGKIAAPLPAEWQPFEAQLRPIFVVHDPQAHTWMSAYLPVYAAMRAAASLFGAAPLLNPLLAAASVLLLAGVAARLWPARPERRLLAAGLLLSSPQFLITSMTAYAMPAHLCCNLAWLWLFTRPGARGKLLAPFVGLLAIGLHQPNVHLLFAFPFCLRLVRERRWRWAAYFGSTYCVALAGWLGWWRWVRPTGLTESAGTMGWPDAQHWLVEPMNFTLLFSWQSTVLGVLVALSLRRWRTLPPLVQDAALSCALLFGFHIFFGQTQGHGWGNRYLYPALGCLVLVAVAGWDELCALLTPAMARRFAAASMAVSLFIAFPLRAMHAEEFARPFAQASAALRAVPAGVVLMEPFPGWYAWDLFRNDPFLRSSPKIMRATRISPEQARFLQKHSPVMSLPSETLARFGIVTQPEFSRP